MPRSISVILLFHLLFCLFCVPSPAEVVRVLLSERSAVLDGKSFGDTGPYERLVGKVYFEIDPTAEANQRISDIGLALTNSGAAFSFRPISIFSSRGIPPRATARFFTKS